MRRAVAASFALLGVLLGGGCATAGPVVDEAPEPSSPVSSAPATVVPEVMAVDGGPIDFAAGAATMTAEGVYDYVVASGDTPEAIGERFGVCTMDVLISNPPQDPWLIPDQTIVVSRITTMAPGTHECRADVDQSAWR